MLTYKFSNNIRATISASGSVYEIILKSSSMNRVIIIGYWRTEALNLEVQKVFAK